MRSVTTTPTPDAAARLRLRIAAGQDADGSADPALPPRLQRTVRVARAVGAPLAPAVDAAMEAQDDRRQAERAVAVASSQTRVVAGGLLLAPLVLVPGLGRLLGADLLGFYLTATGATVLVVGLGLLSIGGLAVVWLLRRVTRRRSPRTSRRPATWSMVAIGSGAVAWSALGAWAGLALTTFGIVVASRSRPAADEVDAADIEEAVELTAIALLGGLPVAAAVRVAATELPGVAVALRQLAFDLEMGTPQRVAEPVPGSPALAQLAELLATAHDVGAPVAPALRRLASQLRADDLAQVLAAAERLPAQLTFPTALCLLPGTVLLVGAPIVQAGLAAAGT